MCLVDFCNVWQQIFSKEKLTIHLFNFCWGILSVYLRMACVSQEMSNKCLKCSVTEILVHQKIWSGGPKFLENWSAGPLFSENLGLCMADLACHCNSLGLLQVR